MPLIHDPRAALLALTAVAMLAACSREATPPSAPADSGAPRAAVTDAAPPAAAIESAPPATEDVPPPEGVLRAYVFECDGGTQLTLRNLYREGAIALDQHEGPRRLPLVESGSGAKYSDGSMTFWNKGESASFERGGGAPVQCRQLVAASLEADARERGVRFRGRGNEPGWMVEVGPGSRLLYAGNFGEDRIETEATTTRGGEDAGAEVFMAETPGGRLKVSVAREPCTDDMSGEAFDHVMLVERGEQRLRGCANGLR
jgi:putative lipoprotein